MKEHLASQTYWLTRLGLKYEEKRSSKEWTPSAHLLAQYDREELYDNVWSQPMRILAQHYGVSDVYLARVCRLLSSLAGSRLLGKEGCREGNEEASAVISPSNRKRKANELNRNSRALQRLATPIPAAVRF